jgi:NAD+ synthetase
MRLALAQFDGTIGDFSGNLGKILAFTRQAKERGCDLIVFPELALIGYPPRDLLDKHGFVRNSRVHWRAIREASEGIGIICGAVAENEHFPGKPYHNAALFFHDGKLLAQANKMLLPSYDVFDEERFFEPGCTATWVVFKGERIGITICEDLWNVADFLPHPYYRCNPIRELMDASVDVVVNISASPYHKGKTAWVEKLLEGQAKRSRMQFVYVNQVGGNDELIFQGHSMVYDDSGRLAARAADFQDDLIVYDTATREGEIHGKDLDPAEEVIEALALGLRDYAHKCGFKQAVLGLSGGIDSAVTACIATLAFGPDQVLGVGMPGPYNAPESLDDARDLAARLGISFKVVPIGDIFKLTCETLQPAFDNLPPDVTEENLQARLRGLTLMALSNKFNRLLLNTGNKSELAVGYCTLYGDMNGGLSVLGDVPKTLVYDLANHLNARFGWIPERTVTRPPSAELRPDQTDQDSLPPYDVLDAILAAYVEQRLTLEEIAAQGWSRELAGWVTRRVDLNEYKRWQAPPVLRVTTKAFGTGRRFPIAHGYRE